MNRLLAFSTLILVFATAGPAQAALMYPTATGITQKQLNFTSETLPNGNTLFTTTDQLTNTNAFALTGVYEVVTSRRINGSMAQWDDANHRWVLDTLFTTATNAALLLPMDRSVTDLAIVPGYGVTTASSLSAFAAGTLAPGASAIVVRQYEAPPGVTSFTSTIGFVSTAAPVAPVPEPATLGACALIGAAGGSYIRRRLKAVPA